MRNIFLSSLKRSTGALFPFIRVQSYEGKSYLLRITDRTVHDSQGYEGTAQIFLGGSLILCEIETPNYYL